MAEVVLRIGVFGVGDQGFQQELGVEDVDAHRGIDRVGIEGRPEGGCRRLFLEAADLAVRPTSTTPNRETSSGAIGQRGQGNIGVCLLVVLEHAAVVHLVDVVAGEDDHVLGLLAADGVDVLIDRVGGAHVPVGAGALHGRQQLEELAEFLGDNAGPSFADMPVERERLVLGEDEDPAQAGVDAVGERDVDDPVVPAEGHGRLGAVAGQRKEPFPGAACKQNTQVCLSCPYEPALSRCLSGAFSARNQCAVIRYGMFQRRRLSNSPLNGEEYHTEITRAASRRYRRLAVRENAKTGARRNNFLPRILRP